MGRTMSDADADGDDDRRTDVMAMATAMSTPTAMTTGPPTLMEDNDMMNEIKKYGIS